MNGEKFVSGCLGKTPYGSKGEALDVMRRREKAGRIRARGLGKFNAYRCRHCHAWHIGCSSRSS